MASDRERERERERESLYSNSVCICRLAIHTNLANQTDSVWLWVYTVKAFPNTPYCNLVYNIANDYT